MTIRYQIEGQTVTAPQLAKAARVNEETIRRRIRSGATTIAAITAPREQRTWKGKAHPWKPRTRA